MEFLIGVLIFIFGAVIGSFLNVVILRLPNGRSLGGRSACAICGHTLGPKDLFPFFSYIFLGGKCRYCGKKISPRYFIIETLTAVLFLVAYLFLIPATAVSVVKLVAFWVILSTLVCVFVIDLEHFLILDEVIFPMSAIILFLNLVTDLLSKHSVWNLGSAFVSGIIGAVAAVLPFFILWYVSRGKWMGFGDVKLAIFLGLALGWPNVLVGLMLAIFLGGIISAFLLALTSSNLKTKLPFGTFLAVGSAVALFYGPGILHWYLSILGI